MRLREERGRRERETGREKEEGRESGRAEREGGRLVYWLHVQERASGGGGSGRGGVTEAERASTFFMG